MLRRVTKQIAEKQINGVLHGVVYETHHLSRATTTSSTHTFEFVLCHAAGFCKEMWRPVIDALAEMGVAGVYHSLDLSGHGSDNSGGVLSRDGQLLPMQSDTPTGAAHPSWWDFGNDVLAVCEHLGPPKPNQIRIGVGHSLGGASIALSQLLRPGLFQSMLLIEPIILGPPDVLNAHKKATKTQNPLYTMTKKRRDKWSSVEVAKSYFASRSAFQNFSPEAVDLFVGHGLYQDNDGDLHLACRPNFEAEIYVMPGANVWDDELSSIDARVQIVCGEDSTHLANIAGNGKTTAEYCQQIADFFKDPAGPVVAVKECGHFVVMEKPKIVAKLIAESFDVPSSRTSKL